MMQGGIYLLQNNGQLVDMKAQAYNSEALLQELLATYPSLLPGDQIDRDMPRHWLLITREAPVPADDDGVGRWAVDHLFLDQDGIPILVEVKRSTDTRLRREVVGQMLDYAANAVVYWPMEQIRTRFEVTCQTQGRDPEEVLLDFLGADISSEAFWQQVKTNLQAGKVRLLFVADEIPPELRRIIEFLNAQMDPAEVLGVEIRQYAGQGLKALVPTVIGQTAEAQRKKAEPSRGGRQWDVSSFLQELQSRRGIEESEVARKILEWTEDNQLRIWWGKGRKDGSFFPMLDDRGTTYWLISVWTYGRLEVQFQMMQTKSPFSAEAKRLELLRRLNTIPGVEIPPDGMTRRPPISLSILKDGEVLSLFLATLDWMIREVRAS
jgi:hypothetical protein